jgi:archaemetzincin
MRYLIYQQQRLGRVSKIILVILSQIDSLIIAKLGQSLEKTFCRPVEIRYEITSLDFAYDNAREQYMSPLVLARFRKMKKRRGDKIIAVTDVDLYSTGYDFVYGEADMKAGVASLSINRLIDDATDLNLNIERIIREATHEMGHLFGLGHCRDRQCVMCTCTCLEEVDAAQGGLCPDCSKKLKPQL